MVPTKLSKKVENTIELFKDLKLRSSQARNFTTMLNSSMPPHKYEKLEKLLSGYTTRRFNAEQKFNNAYKKLNNGEQIEFQLAMNEIA